MVIPKCSITRRSTRTLKVSPMCLPRSHITPPAPEPSRFSSAPPKAPLPPPVPLLPVPGWRRRFRCGARGGSAAAPARVPLSPEVPKERPRQSAPGRTRTCATGSGGPPEASGLSARFVPVLLAWSASPDGSSSSSWVHRMDCQFGLPRGTSTLGRRAALQPIGTSLADSLRRLDAVPTELNLAHCRSGLGDRGTVRKWN
jgi:hypothetical protein